MAARQRPITLEYLAEVRSFLRDNARAEESVEDVMQRLLDAGEAGEDLQATLERAAEQSADAMRDLERATERVADATEEAADDAAQDMNRIGDNASEAGRETGDSFRGALAEGLASGDLSEVFTETLGEAAGSLGGPVGVAAGVLAGGALLVFNHFKQEAEKIKAVVESLGASIQDQYVQGVNMASDLQKLEGFTSWLRDNQQITAEWKDDLSATGISFGAFTSAMYEGGDAMEEMDARLAQIVATNQQWVGTGERRHKITVDEGVEAKELLKILRDSSAEHNKTAGYMQDERAASEDFARNMGLVDTNMDGVIDDSDKIAENTGEIKENLEGADAVELDKGLPLTLADAEELNKRIRGLPSTYELKINMTPVGPMAAYVDPSSKNYSPGHVAIAAAAVRSGYRMAE